MPQFDLMNLLLTWASMDLGLSWIEWLWFPQGAHLILLTVVLSMAHQDLVNLFPIWACMA